MTENGKLELQYHAPVEGVEEIVETGEENKDYIVSSIGTSGKSLNKYQVIMLTPNVANMETIAELETWLKETYDTDLQGLMNTAVRSFSTRVDYASYVDKSVDPVETPDPKSPAKPYLDYPLVEDGHNLMQELALAYKAGVSREKKERVTRAALDKALADNQAKNLELDKMAAEIAALKARLGIAG